MLDERTKTALKGIEAVKIGEASVKWLKKIQEEADVLHNRGKIAGQAEDTIGLIEISAELVILNQMAKAVSDAAEKANEEKIRCYLDLHK